MISLSNLTSPPPMSYFREKSDYFFNNEGKGTWSGQGAQMLGIEGSITQNDFEKILSGKHPLDGYLLREKTGETVRACTDVTFSAPKSLSLIAQFGSVRQQHMVHKSWNDAVEQVISYIENNNSQIREQNNGLRTVSQTDNIIAARFDHGLSRNLDPQLHSHVLVMNMSQSAHTGKWKALHNDSIYKDKASLRITLTVKNCMRPQPLPRAGQKHRSQKIRLKTILRTYSNKQVCLKRTLLQALNSNGLST